MADQDILWDRAMQQTEAELLHTEPAPLDVSADQIVRDADARDINAFISAIAQSHGCEVDDIVFYCDPVMNDDGSVKITEVLLTFSIKTLADGKITNRVVHTMRVKTTQEVQQLARAMQEQESASARAIEQAKVDVAPAVVPATSAPAPAPAPIRARRKRVAVTAKK